MLREARTVSRKTPLDGRLEVSGELAVPLAQLGARFRLQVAGVEGEGELTSMPCACQKGGAGHVHYFVASPLLTVLAAGAEVDVELRPEARRVVVTPR